MSIKQTVRANIRDYIASVLSLLKVTSFSRFPTNSITILTFHRVLPASLRDAYPLPGLVVTPDEIDWVIRSVKSYFDIKTMNKAYDLFCHSNRKKPLLVITFDDGQWDNLEYGLPILNELNIPATFYIPTKHIGGTKLLWHDEAAFAWQQLSGSRQRILSRISPVTLPDQALGSAEGFLRFLKELNAPQRNEFISQLEQLDIEFPTWSRLMNWSEISILAEAGHEIGSHARTHSLLSDQIESEQHQELFQSMTDINNAIGIYPTSFCYPDGNYNEDTLNLLKESDYQTAVTTKWGINQGVCDRLQLRRCDIDAFYLRNNNGELSKPRLQFRLSPYHPSL